MVFSVILYRVTRVDFHVSLNAGQITYSWINSVKVMFCGSVMGI